MIFNLTGVILAEMYASRDGIGHQIATWGENFQMKQLLAGVVMIAVDRDGVQRTGAMGGNAMQSLANVTPLKRAGSIQIQNVGQVFRTSGAEVVALSDVSLDIKPGRFVVLVGPSGCGKSTLLMMLAGLRQQTSGTILVNGAPIPAPDPEPRRRRVPGSEPVSLADRGRECRVSAGAARRRKSPSAAPRPRRC